MRAEKTFTRRVKVNFMITESVLGLLKKTVSPGERSRFVNEALMRHLSTKKKKHAVHMMELFRKSHQFKFTDSQILKAKNYGRE